MKAPDKVFFPNDINLLTKLSLVVKQEGDVCYIRKDALLEWAKDWQNELDDSLGASMVHHVLNEVINKIESL